MSYLSIDFCQVQVPPWLLSVQARTIHTRQLGLPNICCAPVDTPQEHTPGSAFQRISLSWQLIFSPVVIGSLVSKTEVGEKNTDFYLCACALKEEIVLCQNCFQTHAPTCLRFLFPLDGTANFFSSLALRLQRVLACEQRHSQKVTRSFSPACPQRLSPGSLHKQW